MTIYELEKQATPGLTLRLGFETHVSVAKFARAEDEAYWTHCRNNFLKALEALKEEHKVSVGYEEDALNASPHCPEICDVCNLIKELEEVET